MDNAQRIPCGGRLGTFKEPPTGLPLQPLDEETTPLGVQTRTLTDAAFAPGTTITLLQHPGVGVLAG